MTAAVRILIWVGLCVVQTVACAQDTETLSTKRLAFISLQPQAESERRLQAILSRIDSIWPRESRPSNIIVQGRVFLYEAPAINPEEPESPAGSLNRINAEISRRNDAQLARMLAWNPDVIFAPGVYSARAAAKVTSSIPIIFGCKGNPLPEGYGLVSNPARPEKNLTGFTRYLLDTGSEPGESRMNLNMKRMELLKAAAQARTITRVGVIYGDVYDDVKKWEYEGAARRLGLEWVRIPMSEDEIPKLAQILKAKKVDAALVLDEAFVDKYDIELAKASGEVPFPVMFPWSEADLGAWMHYTTVVDVPGRAASFIVKILQGTRVADLPIEWPTQMELAVNFKTANRHGWIFPKSFLRRVDRSIE